MNMKDGPHSAANSKSHKKFVNPTNLSSYKIEVMWSAKLALQTVKQSKLCTPVIFLSENTLDYVL
jgi:hypothetical protein